MIGKVQALAQLPDRGSAERAAHAVVTTLSERLPSGLARHVAAQLPPDMADAMRRTRRRCPARGDRVLGNHGDSNHGQGVRAPVPRRARRASGSG
ncbi:DUF2267 domain-containing protein [Streptomyces murinus]|uniref:DUF2267 domain-containing protein n=1 Tax=Streptomyces murinus TaxID=33900 RepID=UPI00380A5EB9